jgi:predicted transcriptional regulator
MTERRVKDLMVSLGEYLILPEDASLRDALRALRKASQSWPSNTHPPRAALVADPSGRIVGQLGHTELLKALEPRYNLLGDIDILSRAGLSNDLVDAVVDNLGFWEGDLSDVCRRAAGVPVSALMRPIAESIDQEAPISEAIHRMVVWQTMRALVTSAERVVGVLRLADLVNEVSDCLLSLDD